MSDRTAGTGEAVNLLGGAATLCEIHYWTRVIFGRPEVGAGHPHRFTLTDILHLRALALTFRHASRTHTLRDLAHHILDATPAELVNAITITDDRLTLTIDLRLDPTERALTHWVVETAPNVLATRSQAA